MADAFYPEFPELPAEAASYPAARAPVLPILGRLETPEEVSASPQSRFLQADVHPTSSGRAALALALRDGGMGDGHEVLVPGYHCGSMVEPVLWCGARVRFYRMQPDLSVDLDELESQRSEHTGAVLVAHYFGFRQPMDEIMAWAGRHGIQVIEDCAHAFYGLGERTAPGYAGHYAIASTRKFFPGPDGGMVCANPPKDLEITSAQPGPRVQLKAAWDALDLAMHYGRLAPLHPLSAARKRLRKRRTTKLGTTQFEATSKPEKRQYRWLTPSAIRRPMSLATRSIIKATNHDKAAGLRRSHYRWLVATLSRTDFMEPLYPELPDHVVPYMVPALLTRPLFPALKRGGVPIWRWEELAHSDCQVSTDYRTRLVQLPCHQSLREEELNWMSDAIHEVGRAERRQAGTTP